MPPKVSVFMMAYNHKPYIAQALDSILAQDTDFSVEIVIGEDCSTDGTRDIVADYALRYPTKIKALLHKTNIGASHNQMLVLDACKGDYVAICEGDDFWIDNKKLQKQVNFLDKNSDYSICFHRVYELIGSEQIISPDNPWDSEKTFTIDDIALGNFMHTNSVMFRNGLIDSYPDWYIESPIGDFVLHLLNARYGFIKYLPDVMGVYRRFTGTWSSQGVTKQIRKVIQVIDCLVTEDFSSSVINNLKAHKEKLLIKYFEIFINADDYSFIPEMRDYLKDDSIFAQHWILNIYPNRLQQIVNSKSYRFVRKISNFFRNILKI